MVISSFVFIASRLMTIVQAELMSHVPGLNIRSIHSPIALLRDAAYSALLTTCPSKDEVIGSTTSEDLVTLIRIEVSYSIHALS